MNNRQEQIEQARRLITTGISEDLVAVLHKHFPELKESEDERIRKEIIDWMKGGNTYEWQDNKDRWIAYLERKKEQQPAEWSEEDEEMLVGIIERGSAQIPPHEPALREEQMEWLMNRLKSLRPQSKEDLNAIAQREYARGKQDGYWEGVKAERESCKTFHYESPNWPPKMPDLPTETTTNEGVSSIQPHWKPSEEQMEALMLAIEGKCAPTSYLSRRLEDLYEALANEFHVECKLDK